jgi:hypothetical protein
MVLSAGVTSRAKVEFMTEACTVADVRLINWDNYTIVANVFVTCAEWRATLGVPEPWLDGISLGRN